MVPPYISELFLKHFNKTRSSIIHAKYIFELSRYVSNNASKDTETREKENKKNIFNNINSIINDKIKKDVENITQCLAKLKYTKDKDAFNQSLGNLGDCYKNIHLNSEIINEMYNIFINQKQEIDSRAAENNKKTVFGISLDEFMRKYSIIVEAKAQVIKCTTKMLNSNLRLVMSEAKKYHKNGSDLGDGVQNGNLGLAESLKKYNHKLGYKGSTYHIWWIRQYAKRKNVEKRDLVRTPIHMKENSAKVYKAANDLPNNLSYQEKMKAISEKTGLDENKLRKVLRIQKGCFNLDNVNRNDIDNEDIADFVDKDNNFSPYQLVIKYDKRRIIKELTEDLTEREKDIFTARFMDYQDKFNKDMTLEMIGYTKGVTRERVRQIISNTILKLLCNLKNEKYKCIIL